MNWLDLFIIFIVSLYTISGLRDGLLKQLVGLFGFIIAFFVATYASKPLGKIIYGVLFSGAEYPGRESIEPVAETLSGLDFFIGMDSVISVFTFVFLFISFQLLISIFSSKLRLLNRVPIVGFLNILGGFFLGAVKAFILIYILIVVASLLPHDYIGGTLSGSMFAHYFSDLLPVIYVYLKTFFLEHYYLA